jgi:ABC-2 type transport system ATP-binding protein
VASAIALRQVTKTFGAKTAVRDLDLEVPQGALYGIIGPNGAGKTTSIRIMLSILFPDRGEVEVLGHRSALDAKDRIGYLPEERGIYRKMKVGAFLAYMARLKGRQGPGVARGVRQWLERVGLAEVEHKRCEELSKGMQQKVQFLAAIVHEPDLLILDEPFSGLDPVNMRLLRDLVLEQHERGATVLFSTHIMVQAEQICQQVIMIHDGTKVLDATLAEIRNAHALRALWFEPLDSRADLAPLRSLPGVAAVTPHGGAWEIALGDGTSPAEAMRAVVAAVPAARVELRRPTLEDVFVEIVTDATAAGAEDAARLRAELRADGGGLVAGEVRR